MSDPDFDADGRTMLNFPAVSFGHLVAKLPVRPDAVRFSTCKMDIVYRKTVFFAKLKISFVKRTVLGFESTHAETNKVKARLLYSRQTFLKCKTGISHNI